ncbi:hypothetical protein [Clostridium sp.]|uniref:hypothetical protein n=1 Tax=Clostridium sp. TaxID=1506 RepID=UPI0026DAFEB8|nr:hypothetical protein [Clostridium sp.]MDO5039076.1 hypothetical protein [Clostridium sp.]
MQENTFDEKSIFRLSTLLYKDDNYNVKKDTTLRKIIESIFIDNKNEKISVIQAMKFCESKYFLTLQKEEIERIIKKNNDRFTIKYDNERLYFNLENKRYESMIKNDYNYLDKYINLFINLYKYDLEKTRDILYKFLYEIFTTNLNCYQHCINNNSLKENITVDSSKYTEQEIKIINEFLEYEDEEKNKAIFNLVSLSLEYCMLTGNNNLINNNQLRNKEFFLDTNIIYRAIGVNGDDRKELTRSFLKNCKERKIRLNISKYTEDEFNNSLDYYIKQIKKYRNAYNNFNLYSNYGKGEDLYNRYCEWKSGKNNDDLNMFKANIILMYKSLKQEFNIDTNYSDLLDMKSEIIKKNVDETKLEISTVKSGNGEFSNETDAKNVILIEEKRKKQNVNTQKLLEIKYFLISTDLKLREWDYERRNGNQPIVFLPTQWLSIILRFTTRTSNDFKSFVSFLSLRNNESYIEKEKINVILNCISEISNDISTQNLLAREIIENEANEILKENNYDQLEEFVKKESEKIIDKRLKDKDEEIALEKHHKDELEKKYNIKLKEKEEKIKSQNKLNEKRDEYIINNNIKRRIVRNVTIRIICIIFIIVIAILHLFFLDWKYNFVTKIYSWANCDSRKTILQIGIDVILTGVFIKFIIDIKNLLFNKESSQYKKIEHKERNKYNEIINMESEYN